MNDTMLDILKARAERICIEGIRLLGEFSGMRPINTPDSPVFCLSAYGNHYWNKLPREGKNIQTQLLPEIDKFTELVTVLSKKLPGVTQREIQAALNRIRSSVEQNQETWWKTQTEAMDGFRKVINEVMATLAEYYNNSSGMVLAIPDTNAILTYPDIEQWRFDPIAKFDIILTSTVLSELDGQKINHKNPDVREKANKIIRKIKEYRRRGSLQDGVVIVKDRIGLRAIAPEPKMLESLSWFDANNKDDCFLATSLEIIRGNLGARVFIVTGDINMQNKAELAGIPFKEVPSIKRSNSEDGS